VPDSTLTSDSFNLDEQNALNPYFGNVDQRIFVLTNLPEVVKGALFARYSRSAKTVRRLFLDEFYSHVNQNAQRSSDAGLERAERLYAKVFGDYGDDSVAQLGGAHIACEGVSNVLTKVLERGRLMSYLEQSTRYVPYTDRPNGRWKYVIPDEIIESGLRNLFVERLDRAFEIYASWIKPIESHYRTLYPKSKSDSEAIYVAAIRAKALDSLRGLLPSATQSNVGIFGSGQAFESLLLAMKAHPLLEANGVGIQMLSELRKVIPAFLTRVDRTDRGVAWSKYLSNRRQEADILARELLQDTTPETKPEVTLSDFDPDGEIKVVAAVLYASSHVPYDQLLSTARNMPTDDRIRVLKAYVGERQNRRHRPGRAFEHATYCFDVLSDYGAFRDLQRHRMLTIDWQTLTTLHGHVQPAVIEEVGAKSDWNRIIEESADLQHRLVQEYSPSVAQYAVSMAYRIRFYMQMNAREAMHVIELRTSPQGHPSYRRVCQQMHRLIADKAGHKAIAESMIFADHSEIELERLEAERSAEKRQKKNQRDPSS
tara:strand:+ start:892 stop:2514 length:1623 start_codon:yes stop_codon:yes gene_type:complete